MRTAHHAIRGALAAVVALAGCALGCNRTAPTATLRVEPRPFVQQVTADGWLAAATVTPVTVPPQVKTSVRLAWIAPDATALHAGDVVARFDAGALQQALVAGKSSFDGTGLRIVETETASAGEQADVDSELGKARMDLAMAQRFGKRDEDVFSRHEILQSRIDEDLAKDRRHHATDKKATQASRAQSDLGLLTIQQQQAKLKIDDAQAGLAALELRAPHAGLFTRAKNWTGESIEVGAELWRGATVGEIPDLSRMQAKVFVLEADAGGVAPGQRAQLALESRPGASWEATVARIDTVAKPREEGSPVQYFEVTLDLAKQQPELLKLGQRVRATLFVTRVPRALVVPRQALERTPDGQRLYVKKGERFVPRPVTLGPGNGGLVVVTAGLTAGDVIALRPPGATLDGGDNAAEGEPTAAAAGAGGGS